MHWIEWLESLYLEDVWAAGCMVSGPLSDRVCTHVPTLQTHTPEGELLKQGVSNKDKSNMFYTEFFPLKMLMSSVLQDAVYPEPAWEWEPISNTPIHCIIKQMKIYKATKAGTTPNCVYIENAGLLIPFLRPIY
ncbi:hypothetical protein B0H10DRAFT_1950913 [Mycena sp. CBHHK59/15]|nr:hypothetical protein B0H10DRAFT_1950913 [Mycena sp. CBHHK59/15]